MKWYHTIWTNNKRKLRTGPDEKPFCTRSTDTHTHDHSTIHSIWRRSLQKTTKSTYFRIQKSLNAIIEPCSRNGYAKKSEKNKERETERDRETLFMVSAYINKALRSREIREINKTRWYYLSHQLRRAKLIKELCRNLSQLFKESQKKNHL